MINKEKYTQNILLKHKLLAQKYRISFKCKSNKTKVTEISNLSTKNY